MNIYEKMLAIQTELQTVAKNLTVEASKGKGYKAVSEKDIIDAVKPLETKYKVYSYPCGRRIVESEKIETENQYGKKLIFYEKIETTYRFVNIEKPDEYIETTTFAEGIDAQDKGSGKAMTYSDKHALMKAYKISTGDDPDQAASKNIYDDAEPIKRISKEQQKELCKMLNDYFGEEAKRKFAATTGYTSTSQVTEADFDEVKDLIKLHGERVKNGTANK